MGWKVVRIPTQKVANGTFWEDLSLHLPIPSFSDPPIKFIPRKILNIKEGVLKSGFLKKGIVYNLRVDENHSYVAGRIVLENCHPISNEPSDWDIGSFLHDDFEKISIVSGAKGTITVMVKTDETIVIEDIKKWVEENQLSDLKDKGNLFKFLVFRGKHNNLQLVTGITSTPFTSLEGLLKKIE